MTSGRVARPGVTRGALLMLMYLSTVASVVVGQSVVYVRTGAEGRGDGSSWENAFPELYEALARVETPGVVWVAAGTYVPGRSRTDTFRLASGVEVLGGFAGWENPASFDVAHRDFAANETVLSGEIGGATGADNTFHVVTCEGVDATAVLDGFTIASGRASGLTALSQDVGGGLFNIDAHPNLRHCTFVGNRAGSRGGAIHNRGGDLSLVDCRFFDNATTVTQSGSNVGGAIYSVADPGRNASVTLVNGLMSGNRAGVGGGGTGGAIYGGAGSFSSLVNCTLSNNAADDVAGGLYGAASLVNCVLWGNRDRAGTAFSSQVAGAAATITHSCVQGWAETLGGVGNIGEDPLFVDANGSDGVAGTADDDLHLSSSSPCVDVGDNDAVAVATDLDGDPRIVNDRVDLGAYERCVAPADCDDGDACTADRCQNVSGQCRYEPLVCDDAVFCNGAESCVDGVCLPGPPPDCDDGVDCTVDACDQVSDACEHTPDDTLCDNGTPCVQAGYCDPLMGCRGDGVVDCDDAIACTRDACDPGTGECTHTAQDALCDNGRYCDGAETCDPTRGCVVGTPVRCDDGIACTVDTCDEAARACAFRPNDVSCDNTTFCDGVERCDTSAGCVPGVAVDCDDGVACTDDSCDEDADLCRHTPSDPLCDDGLFCTGLESCDAAAGCVPGEAPCAAPLFCDESASACVGCVEDEDCQTDDPCRVARCVGETCVVLTIDGCCAANQECDDANACTTDACVNNACEHLPLVDGTSCDDSSFCNGLETCLDGECVADGPPCAVDETCDESADICLPAAACVDSTECEDGNVCTDDACVDGDCRHEPNTAACDDGDGCTNEDQCAGGQCVGTSVPGCDSVTPPPPPPPPVTVSDADEDGVEDAVDRCPETMVGDTVDAAGCACAQLDDDADGTNNCSDECPDDANKALPGICGCGVLDTDTDDDGTPDCEDDCPGDADKVAPLACGCGFSELDTDTDGTPDCLDACPEDRAKVDAGQCGCGVADTDRDGDEVPDCLDVCPDDPTKTELLRCGCGVPDVDTDEDGVVDCADLCLESAPGGLVDNTGCPIDNAPGQALPGDDASVGRPAACGVCGALGLVSWTLLLASLSGLRVVRRSARFSRM